MKKNKENTPIDYSKKIITIPNILSMFRLCLIPVFVVLYLRAENGMGNHLYFWAAGVLLLSGLTDIADGFIARKFHMVSDFGKIIDPIADKLTQLAMLFCLVFHEPLMLLPLILLAVKELVSGVAALMFIKETGTVEGADWHGKVSTCLLYATMLLHLLWYNIPKALSHSLILACTVMMTLSFVLYMIRSLKPVVQSRRARKEETSK